MRLTWFQFEIFIFNLLESSILHQAQSSLNPTLIPGRKSFTFFREGGGGGGSFFTFGSKDLHLLTEKG